MGHYSMWGTGGFDSVQANLAQPCFNGGTGQGCQDSMYLHYGVGSATSVDSIEVTFPGGSSVTFTGPFEVDQRLWLMEDGSVHTGWAPPSG